MKIMEETLLKLRLISGGVVILILSERIAMKGKIHLETGKDDTRQYTFALCNFWEYIGNRKSRMTDFPSMVTCKKCLNKL